LLNYVVHRPQDFRDAALLVERREVKLVAGDVGKVNGNYSAGLTQPTLVKDV